MPDWLRTAVALVPVGACVGFVGSLIGVGGGFFVVPFLLVFGTAFFPEAFTPQQATAASLGTVLLSALSATSANARRRRVDWRTGAVMALGTIPGAWLGRVVELADRSFAVLFAVLLSSTAVYIGFVKLRPGRGVVRGTPREVVDSDGQAHRYEANLAWGFGASMGVGFIASLFGVGGGLLLVPFMVIVFGAPTLVATATAQFIFVFTSAAGLAIAVARGQMSEAGGTAILTIGPGVVLGAQAGVAIAKKVREGVIRRMIALVLVGVALLMVLRTLNQSA